MQAEILTAISDVTPQVQAAGSGLTGDALVKARTAVISHDREAGLRRRRQLPLPGRQPLPRRPVQAVQVPQIFRRAAGLLAGRADGLLRRRSRTISTSRATTSIAPSCASTRTAQPVTTPDHLKWNASRAERRRAGVRRRQSRRHRPPADHRPARDPARPAAAGDARSSFSELRGRLIRFGEESAEHKRIAQDLLFGLENSYKVYFGRLFALNDAAFMAAEARATRRRCAARPRPGRRSPRRELRRSLGDHRQGAGRLRGALPALPLRRARADRVGPVRLCAQPGPRRGGARRSRRAERLPGYADSQLPLLEKQVLDATPVYPRPGAADCSSSGCRKAREYLTADDPDTKLLLGRDSPEHLSARSPPRSSATRRCARRCGTAAGRRCRPPTTR